MTTQLARVLRGLIPTTIAVLLAVAVGIATGAIPNTGGVIHGCYKKNQGQLRVIDPTQGDACRPSESALDWNQAGPKGDTGPAGPQGPAGRDGAPGLNGKDGASVTSAPEPAGSNCPNGGSSFTAANGTTYACNGAKGDTGPSGPAGPVGSARDVGAIFPRSDTTPAQFRPQGLKGWVSVTRLRKGAYCLQADSGTTPSNSVMIVSLGNAGGGAGGPGTSVAYGEVCTTPSGVGQGFEVDTYGPSGPADLDFTAIIP